MIQIPEFKDHEQLFSYLRKNKAIIKEAKKSMKKEWCGIYNQGDFALDTILLNDSTIIKTVNKAETVEELLSLKKISGKLAINTTNIRDSHKDVHFPGIWNKTLGVSRMRYLLKQHSMTFEDIISDDPKAQAVMMKWAELGFNYPGETQALVFNPDIYKERNPFMFDQYAKGYVHNHSVGMMYGQIFLAMNSDSKYDKEEKDNWDKYANQVVNLSDFADSEPYFFAVTEGKMIEGSAVPLGSNFATPTISIGKDQALPEAEQVTSDEPQIDWSKIAKVINLKN